MIDQKPLFPCCVCSEDYSWPANELRTYKDETWCENCWDETDMNLDEDIFWSDLERFIPEADRKIAELKAEVERLKPYYLAVDDALVIGFIGVASGDAKKDVNLLRHANYREGEFFTAKRCAEIAEGRSDYPVYCCGDSAEAIRKEFGIGSE